MKNLLALFFCLALSSLSFAQEQALDTKQIMQEMKVAFLKSVRAEKMDVFNQSLNRFSSLLAQAQQQQFPADKHQSSLDGLHKVAKVVATAKAQAAKGDLQQAQATLKQVDELRQHYHDQLKPSIWQLLFCS